MSAKLKQGASTEADLSKVASWLLSKEEKAALKDANTLEVAMTARNVGRWADSYSVALLAALVDAGLEHGEDPVDFIRKKLIRRKK